MGQFYSGTPLGREWRVEQVQERMRTDTRPARGSSVTDWYVAKLLAETVLSEPPKEPDLSDEGFVLLFAHCALPPRLSEFPMIRDAFERIAPKHEYMQQSFDLSVLV